MDEALIAEVQEFFGVCLDEKALAGRALVLTGSGANGKSTLAGVLAELLKGRRISAVDFVRSSPFSLAPLVGSRLNYSLVLPTDVGTVKSILSGDLIQVEKRHEDRAFYRAECNLVFETDLPVIAGVARRLLVVRFERSFVGSDRDPRLFSDLRLELEAIRAWSLEGLDRWRSRAQGAA